MRILYITAGAAQMYCGSCLRDNALASELLSRGHDVLLVPLYTPTLTDETNVSRGRVFFGGISVYLEQHSALFRHTPRLLDRLWDSKLALKLASRSFRSERQPRARLLRRHQRLPRTALGPLPPHAAPARPAVGLEARAQARLAQLPI